LNLKKTITIIIILALLTISLGISIKPVNAENTVISVGAGARPVVSGSIIAFVGSNDRLAYYNISNRELVTTVIQTVRYSDISISGNIIAFCASDYTLSYYDISTDALVNTGYVGRSPSIHDSIIAFFSLNFPVLNYNDELCYYNVTSGLLYQTGEIGFINPSVSDSIIAFNTYEDQVGIDLNGDGDIGDFILRYFDMATKQTVNLGFDAGYLPSVSGSIIAFTGDGGIHYYDISTQELKDTGIYGGLNSTSLSGFIITYRNNAFPGGLGYYNILTGLTEEIWSGSNSNAPSIDGSIVTFASNGYVYFTDISQAILETSTGLDVIVNSVGTGVSLTFSDVVTSGETTVSVSTTNPGSEVSNFEFLNTYTSISTVASFEGPVIVSFNYDPSITGQAENTLRVFHWDGIEWTDVTYDLDTVNDVIYAQTTSFSWFALAYKPYEYSGLLQPINSDGSSIFKLKSTVPVKFQLKDDLGNFVSNAVAKIYLSKISSGILGTELEAISTSAATEGNVFRCSQNQYIFNLNTKSLSVGTWQIRIGLDDGTSKYGIISLK
jgi:hypothetical protein